MWALTWGWGALKDRTDARRFRPNRGGAIATALRRGAAQLGGDCGAIEVLFGDGASGAQAVRHSNSDAWAGATSSCVSGATRLEPGARVCRRVDGNRWEPILGRPAHVLRLEGPRSDRNVSAVPRSDLGSAYNSQQNGQDVLSSPVVRSSTLRLVRRHRTDAGEESEARAAGSAGRTLC